MVHTDGFKRSRQVAGLFLGEAALSAIMAAGIGVLSLLILTGFSGEKLILFLHNFTSRAVAADSERMASFGHGLLAIWGLLACLTAAVRFLDRRFFGRPS
ncbi:hypothetical protein HK107_14275 [Parvularcula sp. ZS-1/3]|uniref:Uncharacterized protein n=2 Tax=Parvularcula mediterranea TaxID=2732508 RepID=A0A7Y3W655_9PROT|nr:hypothetical protein [Parvularcula mediterranea]